MKLCAMRFLGYTWHHNPKSLEISSGKKVIDISIPYSDDVVKYFGEKPLKITGVGELYGDDCLVQYQNLKKIYDKGECGILCLPCMHPIYACFEKLQLNATPKKDVLTYSFSFSQVEKNPENGYRPSKVVAKMSQTLWDISSEYDVDIEKLVELNPDIMFLNELSTGQEVCIC